MTGADFSLGDWIIRPQRCSIEHGNEFVRVKPKSMAVLECLARAAGDVVSRNDLFDAVWPGAVVSDDVLTQCVVELRKAFGDSARDAQVIETIPKKGFRLIQALTPVVRKPVTVSTSSLEAGRLRDKKKSWPVIRTLLIGAGATLLAAALFWHQSGLRKAQSSSDSDSTRTIAVLPFVDMSPAHDQGYFADGLSEELINRLTQLEGLQVTGRTSSFYFKGRNDKLRDIGNSLNVSHVLEGSVRKSENQLRITAQLIDVATGFHLWAGKYDRPLTNIFVVQEEIAEAVAKALTIKLGVGGLANVVGGTTNIEAYEELMLANSLARELTADALLKAIEHNRRAIEIDPAYALAWASLAGKYRVAYVAVFGSEQPNNWQQEWEKALAHAISLTPTAQVVLNEIAFKQLDRWQWSNVEQTLNQGAGLTGSADVQTMVTYVDFLVKVGRTKDAVVLMERARRLDPLNPLSAHYLGHTYAMQGRLDVALAEFERGFALDQIVPPLNIEGMVSALSAGDSNLLQRWLQRAIEHKQPGDQDVHETMAELLGNRETALIWLRDTYQKSASTDYYVAIWASYYGETELALKAMRRSPDPWLFWMPLMSETRQLPGFKELVTDIGLVDYWQEFGWGDFCYRVGADGFECK